VSIIKMQIENVRRTMREAAAKRHVESSSESQGIKIIAVFHLHQNSDNSHL